MQPTSADDLEDHDASSGARSCSSRAIPTAEYPMPVSTILLTGAPTWAELEREDAALLSDSDGREQGSAIRYPSQARPRWRTLQLADRDITTATANPAPAHATSRRPRRLSSGSLPSDDAERTFLDDSFAIHEDLDDPTLTSPSSASTSTSFRATADSFASDHPLLLHSSPLTAAHLASLPRISDLAALPSPDRVHRSRHGPCLSVFKVHLLVAVLHVRLPMSVAVRGDPSDPARHPGQRMDVVEIEVADETAGQFRIAFWFAPSGAGSGAADPGDARTRLREQVEVLEAGDAVLVTDVALNVFNGTVCGQSVRGWGSRMGTRLYNLSGVDGVPAADAITEKLQRVNRWLLGMVDTRKRVNSRGRELLPPDTQCDHTTYG